jgi:penicillin-binding protein 1A
MAKKKTKKQTRKAQQSFQKFSRRLWIGVFATLSFVALLFVLAAGEVFGKLPTFEDLENPENNFATEIISIDGKTLGKYAIENRTPVTFEELPNNLVQALVATEDERFFRTLGD